MATTRAPLLSWSASGAIAKTQVYAEWKGRPYVRRYVVPANPDTAEQQLTRNTFRFLNKLYQYLPAGALAAWELYGENSRFTARNGWLKQNNGPLREETTLADIILSPSAGSGLIATNLVLTPGNDQIQAVLTAPSLPVGWSIVQAHFLAVANVNPQTSAVYNAKSATDAAAPYDQTLTGLLNAQSYVVGGWFEYLKPNGDTAFGQSLQGIAVTT